MEREKRMGWYKLRITKRETLYVDDEAEHTVSLVETVGEPIDYEPGMAGEFVARRSVTIHDHIRGSGPIHGYVMADFQHGSVYSRCEGHRSNRLPLNIWPIFLGVSKDRFHKPIESRCVFST